MEKDVQLVGQKVGKFLQIKEVALMRFENSGKNLVPEIEDDTFLNKYRKNSE
ncbi:MAG: hypothetical protein CM15mL4_0080 [uncultured marine virus]|nr:MAG: hypothetical protein CM15mL4_0080 [uncultured marine virus]